MDNDNINYDLAAQLLGVDRRVLTDGIPQRTAETSPRIAFQPLSDDEWIVVQVALPRLPIPRPGGFRDREYVNAVLWYRCALDRNFGWAALPEDFPPRATMQHRWHRWAVSGVWEAIAEALRDDERLPQSRRDAFMRIALEAGKKRRRVLELRCRLNQSL